MWLLKSTTTLKTNAMASEMTKLPQHLQMRRSTINCVAYSTSQGVEETKTFPFSQDSAVKAWNSMENLDSPAGIKVKNAKERPKRQQTIYINVGGKVFDIPKQYALKYPHTRIGSLALCNDYTKLFTLCDDYSVVTKEYFFDRDPAFFHHIFHFYTSGVLWVVREMCPINFEEEMEYWGLSLKDTRRCCRIMFEEKIDELRDNIKVEIELMAEIEVKHDVEGYNNMVLGSIRMKLWNIVENPYSSPWAKAFAVVSNLFVFISIVAMTLNTVEELNIYQMNGRSYMEWLEILSIIFFTFEYFLRLATTSNVKHFFRGAINFVDFVAIMPYFIQIICETFSNGNNVNGQDDFRATAGVSNFNQAVKISKLMRIFRILKIARHSTGMRAFGFTLRQCYQQVCCLFLFLAMGIVTFSALLYSVERDMEGSPFSSIPGTWWWAAVSISTVGYGDVVPVSILGRIVAFACISFGIILNGMPISILFNKFSDYYAKLKGQEYTGDCVQRRLQLKQRLLKRFDICVHPRVQDNIDDAQCLCPT